MSVPGINGTVTPRRGYFIVPGEDDDPARTIAASLRATSSPTTSESETSNLVPPTPAALDFLKESPYQDQGIISWKQLVFASVVACTVLFSIFFLAASPSHQSEAVTLAATPASVFPYSSKDLVQQCHDHHGGMMMHHEDSYFNQGRNETEWEEEQDQGVCHSSLTYVLDDTVGLFFHLTIIVQSYAFAKMSNRSFFIDDSRWDRGRWTDHFQPAPDPGCKRPEPTKMRPCPRGTRHWVMSASLLNTHFGHHYYMSFENPRKGGVERRKPFFEMARLGFSELLVPSRENARLIQLAEEEFMGSGMVREYYGVHVRRGDRHPMNWKWRADYIPLDHFVLAIEERETPLPPLNETFIHLASDSPSAISTFIDDSPPHHSIYSLLHSKHDTLGDVASPEAYTATSFALLSPEDRLQQTRGMIVDFHLLTGGWGTGKLELEDGLERRKMVQGVICTLSSSVCKVAAVAQGWDLAIEQKRWIDVDWPESFDWRPTEAL